MVSLWAEPGEGDTSVHGTRGGAVSGSMKGQRGSGGVTLGEEVGLVLSTPHSKDPTELIREGWVEEHSLPGALGAKSGTKGQSPNTNQLC